MAIRQTAQETGGHLQWKKMLIDRNNAPLNAMDWLELPLLMVPWGKHTAGTARLPVKQHPGLPTSTAGGVLNSFGSEFSGHNQNPSLKDAQHIETKPGPLSHWTKSFKGHAHTRPHQLPLDFWFHGCQGSSGIAKTPTPNDIEVSCQTARKSSVEQEKWIEHDRTEIYIYI